MNTPAKTSNASTPPDAGDAVRSPREPRRIEGPGLAGLAIVAAAVLAAEGSLSLPLVILAGAAGAVIGDSSAYWIGRGGGGPIKRFVTRFAGAERLEAAERMVRRQGPALVFVGRFLPGIRIAINLSCGAGQMAYPRFLFFDLLGGLVWAAQAALLGYFAGKAFADQLWVAFVVAFGVTLIVGLNFMLVNLVVDLLYGVLDPRLRHA